ncbi:MAG TPA: hypothetical protein VKU19_40035 [Bryobacteraceae bacterium]|nr:hypothetical protein [Bryobacteraceae bacterium]
MAFCATCGSPVEGRFCAKCGSAIAAPSAPMGAGPQPGPPPIATAGGMEDNVAAALCYVLGFVTGIIFLVLSPYNQNRTIRFHAFQSIFYNVAVIAIQIALTIVIMILAFLHLGFLAILTWPLGLLFLAGWVYLIVAAFQGKTVVLPIIGPLAQKQA